MEIYAACARKDIEAVSKLLRKGGVNVNSADAYGRTGLMLACIYGCLPIVSALLQDSRVQVNRRDGQGRSSFFLACSHGHLRVVKLLIEDPRVHVNQGSQSGRHPLMQACYGGYREIVEALISHPRIDVAPQVAWLRRDQDFPHPEILGFVAQHSAVTMPDRWTLGSEDLSEQWLQRAAEGHLGAVKNLIRVRKSRQRSIA
jgi:ankyrin repeat protein